MAVRSSSVRPPREAARSYSRGSVVPLARGLSVLRVTGTPYALRVQVPHRVPDRLRPGGLAGVRGQPQARLPRAVVGRGEQAGGVAGLVPGEIDRAELPGSPQDRAQLGKRGVRAEMALAAGQLEHGADPHGTFEVAVQVNERAAARVRARRGRLRWGGVGQGSRHGDSQQAETGKGSSGAVPSYR